MEYHLAPKMIGLAERAWAKDPEWATEKDSIKSAEMYKQNWAVFANTFGLRDLPRLDYYAGGFSYRILTVGVEIVNGFVIANFQLLGFKITYTVNNREPEIKDKEYVGPIETKGTIILRAFDTKGRGGRSIRI